MNLVARWILFALGVVFVLGIAGVAIRNASPPEEVRVVADYVPWDEETLRLAESIPVQDGGRIKPLTTYAGFTMLRFYGARKMEIRPSEDADSVKLKPIAWMMDALFRPHLSVRQPSFRVEDSAVIEAIGAEPGERRDRYSYEDLEPGRERLLELASSYARMEKDERTPLENQILTLAENVRNYEQIIGVFGLARNGLRMMPVSGLPDGANSPQRANASAVMATAPMIRRVLQESESRGETIPPHVQNLLQQILDGANSSKFGLFLFPPRNAEDEHWLSPGERVMNVMSMATRDIEGSIADVAAIETLSRTLYDTQESVDALAARMAERLGHDDFDQASPRLQAALTREAAALLDGAEEDRLPFVRRLAFQHELSELRGDLVERAEARGEYGSIELEADYYRKDWFLYALVWFLLGTILAIAMWMVRGLPQRILGYGVWATVLAGFVYTVIPIVKRCLIMGRPPVGNLYDTIIFITAAVVIFGALVEFFTRRRLALGVLPIAGVILITLARLFEVGDANDHMDPLVAVLRSNYWLTVHVITITLGYAGGLVAALLGIVYVLLRGLRLDGGDRGLRRSLTRGVYGMVCLTLFLSLVGTVLGGIWANDSWGRFWGWDPKENGALMIVLATLAILHARIGGFIREWGIHLASIFLAAVVTFSWWHVNLLGTGLHNYGFTDGGGYVNLLYFVVLFFIGFGFVAMAIERAQELPKPEGEAEGEASRA